MKRFFIWLSKDEGWKSLMAFVYALICVFDFVIVPTWIGLARVDIIDQLNMQQMLELDPTVQVQIVQAVSYQHEPFTLQGGGMFHLAFGALLTGSAITKLRNSNDKSS